LQIKLDNVRQETFLIRIGAKRNDIKEQQF